MGMVLEKDSPLTACVNEALAAVKDNGELQAIYDASDQHRPGDPRPSNEPRSPGHP